MNAPSFRLEKGADQKMLLHYYSDRSGLCHIVPGMGTARRSPWLSRGLRASRGREVNLHPFQCLTLPPSPLLPKFWVFKISFQSAKERNNFHFYFNTENYAGFYIVVIILHIFFCINFFVFSIIEKSSFSHVPSSYGLQKHHLQWLNDIQHCN